MREAPSPKTGDGDVESLVQRQESARGIPTRTVGVNTRYNARPMGGPAAGRQDGLLVADCDVCGFEGGNFSVDVCSFYYDRVASIREFGCVQRILESGVVRCFRKRGGYVGARNSMSRGGHLVAIDENIDTPHFGETPSPAHQIHISRKRVPGPRGFNE